MGQGRGRRRPPSRPQNRAYGLQDLDADRPAPPASAARAMQNTAWTRQLGVAYLAAGLFLACAALAARQIDRPFAFLSKEPASALENGSCAGLECSAAGVVSNVGAVIWLTGGVCALFAAWLLARTAQAAAPTRTLLIAGVLTIVMATDDLLLLHDYAAPDLLGGSAMQQVIPLVYATAGVWLFVRALDGWPRHAVIVLVAAGVLLGTSSLLDVVWASGPHALEDSLKLFGVVTWTLALLFAVADSLKADRNAVPG